jgi:putative DNA methylase
MTLTYQMLLPLQAEDAEGRAEVLPIDHDFDVGFANALARIESYNKHLYRPNTYLHKWWARRCGSTFRAILKHLVESPTRRGYYTPGGLQGKIVLDPMMGGGTTVHEAIRLGANVIGADIDPIPVLQARASLAQIPLPSLEAAFSELFQSLREKMGTCFLTTCPTCGDNVDALYTLYAARRECACGEVWMVDDTTLRHNADGSVIQICEVCHRIVTVPLEGGSLSCDCGSDLSSPRIVARDAAVCEVCGKEYGERIDLPFYARYAPIAIVGQCPVHGLFFRSPGDADRERIARANELRETLSFEDQGDFSVRPGPKSRDLLGHGILSFLDLFSSRQLLYIHHAQQQLSEYPALIRLNLALLLSTSLEFNTMLCGYKGGGRRRPGAVRHAFSYHAYTFPYTALENNPLYPGKASGTLQGLFHYRIRRAKRWARQPVERRSEGGKVQKITLKGEIDAGTEVENLAELQVGARRFYLIQGSSTKLDIPSDSVDYVVTDPPYFDSVQYSDLATFFRVWLQVLLPDAATWDYDIGASAVDPQANGNGQYATTLGAIFAESNRVLKPGSGRLIFTFHHWNPKGWAALTKALKRGGFVLVNRYVVHSENPASVHIQNLKALKHDAILVLAPSQTGAGGDWAPPTAISTESSEQFCADSSASLGWMLGRDMIDEAIDAAWEKLISDT